MNRIFNIIWSKSKERWIVVSEKVKTNGGVPKSRLKSLAVLLALFASGERAYAIDPGALPSGGVITYGGGSITTSSTQLTVNQSTPQMIANWQSFNIGANAGVRFNQPNSSSAALNRITDQNPTQIMGSLSANGRVFLLNPSGIIFGSTARVDVGGLVASSLNMLDSDFIAGRNKFSNSGTAGSILNQGALTAMPGGVVALIAPKVTNEGTITAPGGSVALAAGNQVSLDFQGDGLITLTVDEGAVDALAENKGVIRGDGGMVIMTAKAANALARSAVNNSGIIEARSLQAKDGRIILDAEGGTATVAGRVDASSTDGKGGRVVATGDRVLVQDGAHLTASGATGGGEVLVGGSWQNSDSSVRQATGTIVEQAALLEASAIDTGNGGTVVAWSDVTNPNSVTRAYGTFEAKGGANSGDGGRIETSGHWLDTAGSKGGASSIRGAAGLWLFDPYNVTITTASANGTWGGADPDIWTPGATGSTIINTDITARLDAGTNVTVTTTGGGAEAGNITVSSAILTGTAAGTRTLTLTSDGSIAVNADIGNSSGTLDFTMNANGGSISGTGAISGTGTTTFNVGSGTGIYSGIISKTTLVKSGAGTLTLGAVNTYTGATTISGGTLALNATGTIALSSGVSNEGVFTIAAAKTIDSITGSGSTSIGGAFALTIGDVSNTSSTYAGAISGTGGILTKAGTGTLTLSGANSYTGATNIGAGVLRASNNTALGTTAAGTTVSTGAALELAGGITIAAETLSLNGTGIATGGALRNISGDNSYAGAITLAGNTQISSDSGTLTLDVASGNGITGTNRTLTVGAGSGNVTIADPIVTGTGAVTKTGTGTLTLSGANTYTGATNVSAGTLRLGAAGSGANTPLGTTGAATTVSSGATLDLNGFTLATAEALTLNGLGVGGTAGALTNSSGTAATYSGLVTLGSASSIDAQNGNIILSNTGTISGATFGLTLGGSATGSSIASIIGNTTGTLTKVESGTWTLTGANTYTGATTINEGGITLSGGGTVAGTAFTVNTGGRLTLDNAATNNTNRISDTLALTLNGGEFVFNGTNVAATNASESTGALTLASGASIITLNSGTGG
ncbi:filamentous hemagglutinin N-terminal domain-containing protein, partial [Chlorobium sp. BLA1]|uniref:two-partner secretion domain-containing protein n=1 Tax=Candidatus Chlorobium masyuteum TaxID=2716876 RepID=UPI00141E27C3